MLFQTLHALANRRRRDPERPGGGRIAPKRRSAGERNQACQPFYRYLFHHGTIKAKPSLIIKLVIAN
jgi:hypothetical protein